MFALADSLVATVLDRVPGLAAVYLFGSRAREDSGPGSDIDLAVLTLGDLDAVERWKLQEIWRRKPTRMSTWSICAGPPLSCACRCCAMAACLRTFNRCFAPPSRPLRFPRTRA